MSALIPILTLLQLAMVAGVLFLIVNRGPKLIEKILSYFIADARLIRPGVLFIIALLLLQAAKSVLNILNLTELQLVFGEFLPMLSSMASIIQWMISTAAVLFIGYCILDERGKN